ncbi:hypothetical protein [Candidatus Poriferisodalis sp.]|uniref:hypothetical protein n=1 Tax=Candidatus Poriferisodalis sp. TaxID=3101277 RepID=UPI003B010835
MESVEEPEDGGGVEPRAPEVGQEAGTGDGAEESELSTEDEPEEAAVEDSERETNGGGVDSQVPEVGRETGTEGEAQAQEPEPSTENDPEKGPEGGEPEGETQETEAIPDPVVPDEAWVALEAEAYAFSKECGWFDESRGGYTRCENAEDTLTVIQMQSALLGCEFDNDSGTCKGKGISETGQSMNRQACSGGWGLSEAFVTIGEYTGFVCYRHDHPDYYQP